VLRASGVPVIEFRASIVIGSGSLSFELIRSLVERLPLMVTPRWLRVVAQPIAVEDLLAYLEASLDLELEPSGSRIYEIGGADRVSYGDLMREYARQRGLRRAMLPVPVLTPWLSSLWLGLVTPLFARVGRTLIESICHETVVRDARALRDLAVQPIGARQAIERALASEDHERAGTRWSDALCSAGHESAGDAIHLLRPGRRRLRLRAGMVPPGIAREAVRRAQPRRPTRALRPLATLVVLCSLSAPPGAASELARGDALWARAAPMDRWMRWRGPSRCAARSWPTSVRSPPSRIGSKRTGSSSVRSGSRRTSRAPTRPRSAAATSAPSRRPSARSRCSRGASAAATRSTR
jgi:hypothetical protein